MEPQVKPKHPGGRPLKFQSVEEFELAAQKYFDETPIGDWTITGLAVALGTSRVTLMDYEERDQFFNAIKGAKDKIEMSYELGLKRRGNAGDIFGLKNFGWTDKTEIEQRGQNTNLNINQDGGEAEKSTVDALIDQVKRQTAEGA